MEATEALRARFEHAVQVVQQLPKTGPAEPSDEEKLQFYALYKQATEGPCRTQKPSFWAVVQKFKWEAWHKLGDMPQAEAMEKYIAKILRAVKSLPPSAEVEEFVRSLSGPSEIKDSQESSTHRPSTIDSDPIGVHPSDEADVGVSAVADDASIHSIAIEPHFVDTSTPLRRSRQRVSSEEADSSGDEFRDSMEVPRSTTTEEVFGHPRSAHSARQRFKDALERVKEDLQSVDHRVSVLEERLTRRPARTLLGTLLQMVEQNQALFSLLWPLIVVWLVRRRVA